MRRQTSVRLTQSAIAQVAAVRAAHGLSQDAFQNRLVSKHVREQHALDDEARHVHLSTVLQWPPPALGRRGGQRDGRVRVPVRLEDETIALARETAFILPGQAPHRGPADYKARPLTDALTTALALAHPYAEDGLEDLPATLTTGRRWACGA